MEFLFFALGTGVLGGVVSFIFMQENRRRTGNSFDWDNGSKPIKTKHIKRRR